MYFAHSAPPGLPWEPAGEHLRDVAETAASFAAVFGAAEEARAAGLLHDLGKYSERFTRRLQDKEHGLDHWSIGAWAALTTYKRRGIAAALAVQGHHVGLHKGDEDSLRALDPRRLCERHPWNLQLTEVDLATLQRRLTEDRLVLPRLERSLYEHDGPRVSGMLDVRMLFSALVDADFIETEAHFRRGTDGVKRRRPGGPELHAEVAAAALERHLADLERDSTAAVEVRGVRSDLLRACLEGAEQPSGLYTLTAPTGAGKTLAMLAFALRHARRHGLRRVVVVIPYLSIIEQTARTYRQLFAPVFGDHFVLEHHSLAGTRTEAGERSGGSDAEDEGRRLGRLLAENWDAPLVVTTSVQLLESLFSNRPSACRKLHRLARSVLLFDEVQTLPPALAPATLAALSRLAERYGSTVVFATATQPAFDRLDQKVKELCTGGWRPREIVAPGLRLFDRARRVRVDWDVAAPRSWDSLAAELAEHGTALCIVNLKRHAQELAGRLKTLGVPGLFHLSTNMCPAHREGVLAEVRRRLDRERPEPCLLVSTQCVEAGVDVDFPFALRALGPLDAVAQAAGRCNRNGRLAEGIVRVFRPEEDGRAMYPPSGYEQATSATEILLRDRGAGAMDIASAELFRSYYELLYGFRGLTGADRGKTKELREAIETRDFAEVAARYRLIDQGAINVVVPFDPRAFARLRTALEQAGRLTRHWIRDARPHAVSLFRPAREALVWSFLQPAPLRRGEESEEWFIYLEAAHYDRELLGLLAAPDQWIA